MNEPDGYIRHELSPEAEAALIKCYRLLAEFARRRRLRKEAEMPQQEPAEPKV